MRVSKSAAPLRGCGVGSSGVVVLLGLVVSSCLRAGFDVDAGGHEAGTDAWLADSAFGDSVPLGPSDGVVDSSPVSACGAVADPDTVALFLFDESTGSALVDRVDGTTRGSIIGSGVSRAQGPSQCGIAALSFPAVRVLLDCQGCQGGPATDCMDTDYVVIDDGPQPTSASVELWIWIDPAADTRTMGILSRDAKGRAQAGHFSIDLDAQRRLNLRLQAAESEVPAPGGDYFECSQPLELGRWYHVGAHVGGGPFELFLDGARQSAGGRPDGGGTCGTGTAAPTSLSLDGNRNPWVIGGDTGFSCEGSATPLRKPFSGRVAGFRVRQGRRF